MAIHVRLEPELQEQLRTLARRERRRPQEQAAYFIERALRAEAETERTDRRALQPSGAPVAVG